VQQPRRPVRVGVSGGLAQVPANDDRRDGEMSDWSSRLSKQYHLNLPADVVAWFDGERWKEFSETGFGVPLEPAQLLDSNSSVLLGGLMLPDALPILDNGCGDALCLRFNSQGTVSEVVRWMHEGGNWTPLPGDAQFR
jgi:hypothetical protein